MSEQKFIIDKKEFLPGQSGVVKLSVGNLPSDTKINILAHIFRAVTPGPTTLILAGVHGDEINGIEIVRRLLMHHRFNNIQAGNLIVIPLLNIYGFITFNRYVPDGKDVNRSFPGTSIGSLASRIARSLTKHILPLVDYIFDFHTGGDSRYNYPQIRYTRNDTRAFDLAKVFSPPFIIESGVISKSLRKTAKEMNIPMLIYEGGESVRLNNSVISQGYNGILRCLTYLGYIEEQNLMEANHKTLLFKKTTWLRASFSGIFLWSQKSGAKIYKGEKLGSINDPNGQKSISVITKKDGYLIGHNNASVVNQGDALFHIGYDIDEIL